MNNENTWTQGGEHHALGSVGVVTRGGTVGGREVGEEQWAVGRLGRDNMGRNARYR